VNTVPTRGIRSQSPIPDKVKARHRAYLHQVKSRLGTLQPLARRLLSQLLLHVDNAQGTCWPGPSTLSRAIACNSDSIYRSRGELAQAGLIQIMYRRDWSEADLEMYPEDIEYFYRIDGYADLWIETIREAPCAPSADVTLNSEPRTQTLKSKLKIAKAESASAVLVTEELQDEEPEMPSPISTAPIIKTAAVNVLVEHDVSRPDAISIIGDPDIRVSDDALLSVCASVACRYRQWKWLKKSKGEQVKNPGGWWRKALRDWRAYAPSGRRDSPDPSLQTLRLARERQARETAQYSGGKR